MAVSKIGPSGLNDTIVSGKTALAATPADTDEFLISDAGTIKRIDYSYIKASNAPVWRAKITSQTLGYNSATKIDYNQELQDTASAYNTSNKRFTVPSGLGGTYMIGGWYRTGNSTDVEAFSIFPYVNGSTVDNAEQIRGAMVQRNYNTIQCSGILELSASDYIEMYAFNNDSNDSYTIGYSNEGMFWGFRLAGV